MRTQHSFLNGQQIWTDASLQKVYRWQIYNVWQDAYHHLSLENFKLKWDTTIYLLEWLRSNKRTNQVLVRMWSDRNSHLFLVGRQNGASTWEDSFTVSYKAKYNITIQPSNCSPRSLPSWFVNLGPYKNLHVDVYSILIHNCQKLEATKMSFSMWMDKQTGTAIQWDIIQH